MSPAFWPGDWGALTQRDGGRLGGRCWLMMTMRCPWIRKWGCIRGDPLSSCLSPQCWPFALLSPLDQKPFLPFIQLTFPSFGPRTTSLLQGSLSWIWVGQLGWLASDSKPFPSGHGSQLAMTPMITVNRVMSIAPLEG